MAFNAASAAVASGGTSEVPLHLRNAPTELMKELDHGVDYRYAHDEEGAYSAGESYFPEALKDAQYYHPVDRGLEIKISEKLQYLRERDKNSTMRRYL
jgi:putative ATPase